MQETEPETKTEPTPRRRGLAASPRYPLIVIALAKAWLIVSYFMHVARVWQGEEESE
ncbi:MAG: cytochrome C oxidase subunit IV family protein [Chloroflexi bacterium]|nr:cytochrome C oxidase subunit IV family protein [Chloroflexota bacterium]